MAKKTRKSSKSLLPTLLGTLLVVTFLFGYVVFNKEGNPAVKGDSTSISLSCNMSVHPARTCPSGYECRKNPNENPMFVGGDGICMKQDLANAGEACGRNINQACRKDLICAPLGSSYRLLNTIASEVESTTESETVSTDVQKCIGKTEDEIKIQDECYPYIPYYGACVKKGVWPPPQKKTAGLGEMCGGIVGIPCESGLTCDYGPERKILPDASGVCVKEKGKPTPTPISGCIPKPPCVDGIVDPKTGAKLYCDPKPGTIFCTPTPTPSKLSPTPTPTPSGQVSCGWCGLNCVDKSTMQACIIVAPPQGYSCVYKNNVCVKEKIKCGWVCGSCQFITEGVNYNCAAPVPTIPAGATCTGDLTTGCKVIKQTPTPISVVPVQNIINNIINRLQNLIDKYYKK